MVSGSILLGAAVVLATACTLLARPLDRTEVSPPLVVGVGVAVAGWAGGQRGGRHPALRYCTAETSSATIVWLVTVGKP